MPAVEGESVPVVIVGAGPAGLAAGITLGRYGVECLIVDRRTAPGPLPRATVVSVRNMELLRSWGLEDEIRRRGDDVECRLFFCSTLADADDGRAVDVGYPTHEQSVLFSPTSPACVPQDHLETVLLDHLRTFPSVHVELGAVVEDVRPVPDGVEVVVRDLAGTTRTVSGQYAIGADGGRSIVREGAGIGVRDWEHLREALTVVFHAPLWDVVGPHRYVIYGVEHPVPATFLPAGHGDRWVYGFDWDPTRERIDDYPPARLVDRIRTGAGRRDLDVRLGRVGSFSFTASLADQFRRGRVFLTGDAAHRVTPRGGTGMNTAIGDGFDLGWKLGWVLNGWAPESLLGSYEAERRPVAEHNLARSIDPDGTPRSVLGELNVDLGGRIRHLWLAKTPGHPRVSTLDLVGPGLTLLTGPASTDRVAGPVPFPRVPITTRYIDGATARGLGISPGGGIFVRPDGVPMVAWNHRNCSTAASGDAANGSGHMSEADWAGSTAASSTGGV